MKKEMTKKQKQNLEQNIKVKTLKQNTKSNTKTNQGITLIALVITIIVLLILAGVAISMLSGENGILSQAAKAKTNTDLAQFQEALTIAYNSAVIDQYTGGGQASLVRAIEEVKAQGYAVKEVYVSGETITGAELSNSNISVLVGGNTATVTVTLKTESGEAATKYFAEISGKYYEITQTSSKIEVANTPTDINSFGAAPTITVSTSDSNIATATIEESTITVTSGTTAGTANLDVTVNGTTYSTVGIITVAELQSLSYTELTLDGAHLLTAKLSDGTQLINTQATWSSDNENVATVTNEGIVKCSTQTGTATISCTAGSQTLQCTVTSTAKIIDTNNGSDNRTVNGQDKAYNNPTLPVGFSAIDTEYSSWSTTGEQTDINKGLVIMDDQGNQFVWIPVENAVYDSTNANATNIPTSTTNGSKTGYTYTPMAIEVDGNYKGILYNYDSTGGAYLMYPSKTNYQGTSSQYREPDTLSDYDGNLKYLNIITSILTGKTADYADVTAFGQTMQDDYDKMVESVKTYGGFYVGRYESSLIGDSTRAVSGATSMNASESTSYRWYGLYARGKSFSTEYVQGSMIWGSQYDAMMNWMVEADIDVTSKTPTTPEGTTTSKNKNRTTGTATSDKLNNIFDLLGNSYEWTLESYYTSVRLYRGGSYYNYSYSPAYRSGSLSPLGAYDGSCSRLSLYIVQN